LNRPLSATHSYVFSPNYSLAPTPYFDHDFYY